MATKDTSLRCYLRLFGDERQPPNRRLLRLKLPPGSSVSLTGKFTRGWPDTPGLRLNEPTNTPRRLSFTHQVETDLPGVTILVWSPHDEKLIFELMATCATLEAGKFTDGSTLWATALRVPSVLEVITRLSAEAE